MYSTPQGQRARIAALYFPLIPLVLDHVTRLDSGSAHYISPMLNATSMAFYQSRSAPPGQFDSVPPPSATSSKLPCLLSGVAREITRQRALYL